MVDVLARATSFLSGCFWAARTTLRAPSLRPELVALGAVAAAGFARPEDFSEAGVDFVVWDTLVLTAVATGDFAVAAPPVLARPAGAAAAAACERAGEPFFTDFFFGVAAARFAGGALLCPRPPALFWSRFAMTSLRRGCRSCRLPKQFPTPLQRPDEPLGQNRPRTDRAEAIVSASGEVKALSGLSSEIGPISVK
jgi:hypothetical protein